MQGCIFSIEEFSVYDGPGIRTTVFLKGCPLRCNWCHNPEGQNFNSEIVRSPNGCIRCNKCADNAVVKNGKIAFTQQSIENCPMGLLRVCGENITSSYLCEKLLKNSNMLINGGVTFSGGEPLSQSEFLFECLEQLSGKMHTAIQTSGFCERDIFEKALQLADYFLFDIKIVDDTLHQKYTNVSNKKILENFKLLVKSQKKFVVRVPLIPSVTDTTENILSIVQILKENNVKYLELLPYNKMAGGKYKMLDREYKPLFDEHKEINIPTDILISNKIRFNIL